MQLWLPIPSSGPTETQVRDGLLLHVFRKIRARIALKVKKKPSKNHTHCRLPHSFANSAQATVSVAPLKIPDTENWLWKEKKVRIRGGAPSKIRLSTPYFVWRKDVDRFLASFDEYKTHKA